MQFIFFSTNNSRCSAHVYFFIHNSSADSDFSLAYFHFYLQLIIIFFANVYCSSANIYSKSTDIGSSANTFGSADISLSTANIVPLFVLIVDKIMSSKKICVELLPYT